MELFMLLLAVGASTSEKLNRGYLPPPGAKFAGGNPLDLQTPLEYPKETPTFETRKIIIETGIANTSKVTNTSEQLPVFNQDVYNFVNNKVTESAAEMFDNPSTVIKKSYSNLQNTPYSATNDETTDKPFNLDLGYTKMDSLTNYDESEYLLKQQDEKIKTKKLEYAPGVTKSNKQYFHNVIDNINHEILVYSNDENKHVEKNSEFGVYSNIVLTNNIRNHAVQNFQPEAFGMYGGYPMIIKWNKKSTQDNSRLFDDNSVKSVNNSFETEISSNLNGYSYRKPDNAWITLSPFQPEIKTTTGSSVKFVSKSNNARNKPRKLYQKRTRPQAEYERKATAKKENVITLDGYTNSFETSNGIHKVESATTVNGVKALGSYSYTGDDGKVYGVVYSADENGFQPKGDHLPTPPPIPKAIQLVIEQANKDKEAGIIHDGFYDEEKYGHMKYQGPIHRYLQKKNYKSNFNSHQIREAYKLQRKLAFDNKGSSRSRGAIKYLFDENKPKVTTTFEDVGYFYVPPINVFIEGRFQDKTINGLPKQINTTYNNERTEPSGYDINEGNNPDNEKNTTKNNKVIIGNNHQHTTPLHYFQDRTNIFEEMDGIPTDNNVETDFTSQNENFHTSIYHSTTAMTPQMKHKNEPFLNEFDASTQTFDATQADNKNGHYNNFHKTTPQNPVTIEDLSNEHIDPVLNGLTTVKVDGFGKTIDDTLPDENIYFSTNIPLNKLENNNYVATTEPYFSDFQGPFTNTVTPDKVLSDFPQSIEGQATSVIYDEVSNGSIVGEDFAGPQ